MDVGRNIQNIRRNKGIKQKDVAKELGVTPAAISAIERNGNSINIATLMKIADVLDEPITEFIKEDANGTNKTELFFPRGQHQFLVSVSIQDL